MATKKVVEYTPKGLVKGISVSSSVKISKDYNTVSFDGTIYKEYTEEDNKDINISKEMTSMYDTINFEIDNQIDDFKKANGWE